MITHRRRLTKRERLNVGTKTVELSSACCVCVCVCVEQDGKQASAKTASSFFSYNTRTNIRCELLSDG